MSLLHRTSPAPVSFDEPRAAGSQTDLLSSVEPLGWQEQDSHGFDAVEAYFQCITTCSLEDGACITRCVEQLRDET